MSKKSAKLKKQPAMVKKLLLKQTVEKLDAALSKGNMEQLKKQMEKLFTFKNIFNLHDDHLIELAECIVDLSQAGNKAEFARSMEQYVRGRISRYYERKKKLSNENLWANAAKNMDEVSLMDLRYRLWVYESGFEYSHFCMYSMLCNITQGIQKYGEEGAG